MEAITRNLNVTNNASQHKFVTSHVIKVLHERSESFFTSFLSCSSWSLAASAIYNNFWRTSGSKLLNQRQKVLGDRLSEGSFQNVYLKVICSCALTGQFHASGFFLYPLKALEKCFQGIQKETNVRKWVMNFQKK